MATQKQVQQIMKIINESVDEVQIALAKTLITIDELIEYYESLPKDSDCRCAVCRGSIRSTTTLCKSEGIHLIELAYQSKDHNYRWHMYSDITNSTNKHWGTKSTKGTQLEIWGLLETSSKLKRTNAVEVENVKAGSQRLTTLGYDFVNGKVKVFETVYKNQFGHAIGWSTNKIGIYDVRGQGAQLTKKMVESHYKNRTI